MKKNMFVTPVVKILRQTLISQPRWKARICGLKNQESTCYLNFVLQTLFVAPEFPSKYIFCTLCQISEYPST